MKIQIYLFKTKQDLGPLHTMLFAHFFIFNIFLCFGVFMFFVAVRDKKESSYKIFIYFVKKIAET